MAKMPALETEIAKIAVILRDGYVSSYVKTATFTYGMFMTLCTKLLNDA